MKRVIKASYVSYARRHPEIRASRNKLRAAEHDIEYLETCKTLEDVKNHTYEVFHTDALVRKLENSPESEHRDIIDRAIDSYSDYADYEWERYVKSVNKLRSFKEYVAKLKPYMDIELKDDYAEIYVDEDFSHDDLVELVDTINSVLDSRYHGTGRGGSWTAYNIMTPEKVELQVGNIDQVRDCDDCVGIQVVAI